MSKKADKIARGSDLAKAPTGGCAVFGKCGGCSMLDVPYAEQLRRKQRRVIDIFGDLAKDAEVADIAGMVEPYRYRDKVIAPFVFDRTPAKQRTGKQKGTSGRPSGKRQGGGRAILTGMYAKGTHRVIEAPGGCLLENDRAHEVVEAIRSIMLKHSIEPYDEDRGRGFLRHAQIRIGHRSGEVLVTLVTNSAEFPHSKSFCRELLRRAPFITTIVQNANMRDTNVVLGDEERTLYGPGFILDELCGATFRLSSRSFYQVNAEQTEVLYKRAMELAGLSLESPSGWAPGDRAERAPVVLDAYCGTGTIGIIAAKAGAGRVLGVDSVSSAIRDARQNAAHNGIEDAEYICEDAADLMARLESGSIDIAFMDPPRAGATERFLDSLARTAPKRIVYISCDPTTQARDAAFLQERGYSISAMQPVDMFPHTDHIENIIVMDLDEEVRGEDE